MNTCILPAVEAHGVLENFRQHQADSRLHPLTCGNGGDSHCLQGQLLPHDATRRRVILVCQDCDYRQTYIPPFLINWGPGGRRGIAPWRDSEIAKGLPPLPELPVETLAQLAWQYRAADQPGHRYPH